MRVAGVAILLVGLILALPGAAAHAEFERSEPAGLTGLPKVPQFVILHFTEPVNPERSAAGVFDENLLRRDTGNATVDPADPTVMRLYTGNLIVGKYRITYQITSADDGHFEKGSVPFTIGVPGPLTIGTERETLATADIPWVQALLKTVGYASLALVLSALVFRRLVIPRTFRKGLTIEAADYLRRADPAAAIAAFAGVVAGASLLQEVYGDISVNLRAAHTVRLAALALLALAFWSFRGRPVSRWLLDGSLAVGVLAAVTTASLGHAAGDPARLLLQSAHVTVLLAWVGGLLFAALYLGTVRSEPERREGLLQFSRVAVLGVAALILTGTLLGAQRLREWGDFTQTAYGQALLLKIFLALALLWFGSRNHQRLWEGVRTPRPGWSPRDAERARATVKVEATLAALILGITGILGLVAVPADEPEPPPPLRLQQWWGNHNVTLEISPTPLAPGEHVHAFTVRDKDLEPVDGMTDVTLTFIHLDLDIGRASAPATFQGSGRYESVGSYLSALGRWQVRVQYTPPGVARQEAVFEFPIGKISHFHGGGDVAQPHFDSGYLPPGGRFARFFTARDVGNFNYHCHPHQWMIANVTVAPDAPEGPSRVTIQIYGNASDEAGGYYYRPARLSIRPSTEVEWVNSSDLPHTATNVVWRPPANATQQPAPGS